MQKIVLTGATGFLGSHLLKGLLYNTDNEIVVLKRSHSAIDRIASELANNRVIYYDVDVCDLESVFRDNDISVIIHCATNYGRSDESCLSVLESNLMFPIGLLELAVKYGVRGFINTDSYFNKPNFSYPYLLNYSLSKKSLLLWLKYFSNKIQIVNLVLEHIYGEYDNSDKFVFYLIDKIVTKQEPFIDLTFGEQKRDFIYVEDVVSAYLMVLEHIKKHKFTYKSFDVGTGKSIKVKDFVEKIKELSKSTTKLNYGALAYRESEIMDSVADIKPLTVLGWKPKYSYTDALKKMISGAI